MTAACWFQPLLLLLLAPLIQGCARKLKACLQNRTGASVLQPYWDLLKNLRKEEVLSETASPVMRAAPYAAFSATFLACFLVPVLFTASPLGFAGDMIALVYLLALPRFFMALAGLDAGSAFGGMGSSREMMISSAAEPALVMVLFSAAVRAGSTGASETAAALAAGGPSVLGPGLALGFIALFLVALAECGRLPVDNPATHLELTMVHEAMILEHSGRSLALLELASSLKLTLFLTLLANLFIPWGMAGGTEPGAAALSAVAFLLKLGALVVTLSVVETSTAKLRLFRVPDFLGIAFVLALLGLLSEGILRLGL
ncbi:MAG: NADH-quinone oxidoreductase subunit H [Elusimicrobia bacterium]|nr:NADH-quinone oxidoreductase subunit H [Elusimicrobiota bacterium]